MNAVMVWGLLTAVGDLRAFFKELSENGVDCIRFFINYLEDGNQVIPTISPYEIVGHWNPQALDGKPGYPDVPVRSLAKRSEAFMDRLRVIAGLCFEYHIIPWPCMDDQCSKPQDGSWNQFLDVYYGCQELWQGWRDGKLIRAYGGGDQALELNPYRVKLEEDVLMVFRSAGCSVVYGTPSNEWGDTPGEAYTLEMALNWHQLRCISLDDLGYTKIIGSWREPITPDMIAEDVDWLDFHQVIDPEDTVIEGDKWAIVLNTDGGYGKGRFSATGIQSLSVGEAKILAPVINASGYTKICIILQEATWDLIEPQQIDDVDLAPSRVIAEDVFGWQAKEEVFEWICRDSGTKSNEYCPFEVLTKFIKGTEPISTCSVHKKPIEPPPPPPGEKSCSEKFIKGRADKKWQLGKYILCILKKLLDKL